MQQPIRNYGKQHLQLITHISYKKLSIINNYFLHFLMTITIADYQNTLSPEDRVEGRVLCRRALIFAKDGGQIKDDTNSSGHTIEV